MTLLSDPPWVVGTINPFGLDTLARGSARDRVVDLVEARLDLALAIGEGSASEPRGQVETEVDAPAPAPPSPPPPWARFFESCARLEATGTPTLATIRLVTDGGRWTEDAARLDLFERALAAVSFVDVELESQIAAPVVARAHAQGKRVIVSHHDFLGTPAGDVLDALLARARALGADIAKVATLVDSLEAHDRLVDFLRRQRLSPGAPLALIGMGPLGTSLRTYLPCLGSRLTYGFLDQVAATGQIPAPDLVRRLVADCPAYALFRRQSGRL